jgi:outer membrane protein OmpA-like peptidoglycan-associated protein
MQVNTLATTRVNTGSIKLLLSLAAAALLISGCATAPVAPKGPVPFEEAVAAASRVMFSGGGLLLPRPVVIDPILDGVSGEQTVASRLIETRLREIAKKEFSKYDIRDFNTQNVAAKPLAIVGTLTGLTADGKTVGKPDSYRVSLALVDLASNKVISRGEARSTLTGVDITRSAYYADSPVWVRDETVDAYIQTAETTKVGDAVNPIYRSHVESSPTIAEAIVAYEAKSFAQSLELYQRAATMAKGDELRVYTGLYMANWKLGKRAEAEEAFGKIVDTGLAANKLSVKFLFQPGRTDFWADTNISGAYGMWVQKIATRVAKVEKCLDVVGHTSRSGNEQVNEKLSLARADAVKRRLATVVPTLGNRTNVTGMGYRENLVGSGADDLTDLQDRRVEFKLTACGK